MTLSITTLRTVSFLAVKHLMNTCNLNKHGWSNMNSAIHFSNMLATNQESNFPTPITYRLKIALVMLFPIVLTKQKEKKITTVFTCS